MKIKFLIFLSLTLHINIFGQTHASSISLKANPISQNYLRADNIINDYTPVISYLPCNNSLLVEDGSAFKVGDTVLMIQMKGAQIDSSNSATFGSVANYNNAGNYEFNYIKQKNGNQISLKNNLLRGYDLPNGKVQLIRVPYFTNAIINTPLTCLPWDGRKGGVLVLNAAQNVILNANLDVTGKGFTGGIGYNSETPVLNCFINQYNIVNTSAKDAGLKGESIVDLGLSKVRGKGAPASGGGGGLGHNSGGGGGANAGAGGYGGYQLNNCGGFPFENRGVGGYSLPYNSVTNKIFLGGGGGAGNADNPQNLPPDGGNGGGIIIVKANQLTSNGNKIIANGANAYECMMPQSLDCHDGMGGGGAGGTVLLEVNNFVGNIDVLQNGGNGADMKGAVIGGKVGAGGGGGAGVLFVNNASLPASINSIHAGGKNGVLTKFSNEDYGAVSGSAGTNLFNLSLPFTTTLFKPNIDSVRIDYAIANCNSFNFQGLGYTNASAITKWNWNFGDGATAATQNPTHTFANSGSYNVKLIVDDINGCKDSFLIPVTVDVVTAEAGIDTAYCSNNSVVHILKGTSNAANFSWIPSALLNNSGLQNPTATINTTTKFYVTTSNANGCTALDSVTISVNPLPQISTIANNAICENDSILLTTTGTATSYQWLPANAVTNAGIQSPLFIGTTSTQMIVTGSDAFCKASDTVFITVNSKPLIKSIVDTTVCGPQNIELQTTGGQFYSWSPATNLSDPNIANPIFTGTNYQQYSYVVTGEDALGCKAKDTVNITIASRPKFALPDSFETCKNIPVQLSTNNNPSFLYQWTPNSSLNNASISNPMANPPSTTIYTVRIVENTCFTDTVLQVKLQINDLPIVRASKSNDIDCAISESQLTATGAQNYVWSPATTLNNSQTANPIASPVSNTTYQVTGTNDKGCTNKDSVRVLVTQDKLASYFVANSFSPNGDQVNDCFGIGYWNSVSDLEFKIYNRFGQLVFSTKNKSDCWDGKFKGRNADIGNYVYYIKANTLCGKVFRKGNLLLLR